MSNQCRLLHDWGKWTDAKIGTAKMYSMYLADLSGPVEVSAIRQTRVCVRCDKTDVKIKAIQ